MQTICIFEDIFEDTLYKVNSFLSLVPDDGDVLLEVASHGGLVFYGNAIFQKIQEAQSRGVKFTAKVYGIAASSAADIVLACDRVEMANTATIMIHSAYNPSGKDGESISIANAAQLSVIHKRLPEYTEKDLEKDRWFTAQEALEIGLIDAIFDVKTDSPQAWLCAKYLLTKGEVKMDEEKKVEVEKVDEVEEKREEETPSIEEILEKMTERFAAIEERLQKIEEGRAECGDRRDNARMKAVYEKIAAVSKPCVPKESVVSAAEDPKASLDRFNEQFPGLERLVDVD